MSVNVKKNCFRELTIVNPSSSKMVKRISARSCFVGLQWNFSIRPSRRSGAYSVFRSFAVTMIGHRFTLDCVRQSLLPDNPSPCSTH